MKDYKKLVLTQRKFIGGLGICLPPLVLLSCLLIPDKPNGWNQSMSITYHLSPVLTAGLSAVALFLWFYEGYDDSDKWINRAAAIASLFVAFVPCSASWASPLIGVLQLPQSISNFIHDVAALLLFIFLFTNVLFNFTKGTYVIANVCYYIISALMLLDFLNLLLSQFFHYGFSIWWFEFVFLILFGIAWLIKGKGLEIITHGVRSAKK